MYLVVEIYSYTNNKVRVKLDNGFTFALYKGEIRKYKIKENEYIVESVLQEIVDEILLKRAKERALFLLKDSSKTKKQIYDKLRSGFYPDIVIENVIKFLEKYSYIDDYEYALNYIEHNSRRKSALRIKMDLYAKGVDKYVIESAFEESDIDEERSINNIIESKIKKYDMSNLKDRQKFYALLLRNGYSYDVICRNLRKIGAD